MMTHEERVWHHEMETLEGIHEHAERIASLEELVQDMWKTMRIRDEEYGFDVLAAESFAFSPRMRELGIEVPS